MTRWLDRMYADKCGAACMALSSLLSLSSKVFDNFHMGIFNAPGGVEVVVYASFVECFPAHRRSVLVEKPSTMPWLYWCDPCRLASSVTNSLCASFAVVEIGAESNHSVCDCVVQTDFTIDSRRDGLYAFRTAGASHYFDLGQVVTLEGYSG